MLLTETNFLAVFNLLAGALLGYILYRSDFCMAGIFRDVFLFRQYALLRPLVLLVVLTMVLFSLARLAGLILVPTPPFFSYPSGATLTGGLLFGIGMVLAGGCAISTIYRMAGGNLASMTAFIGMIAGSMVYAEFHHQWEPVKKASVFVPSIMLADVSPAGYFLAVAFAALIFCLAFGTGSGRDRWTVTAYARSYLQPWKAVVVIAVLNTAVYVLSGWPLSIMTGYAKLGAYIENLFAPAHVASLPFYNAESISLALSGVPITGGAAPGEDVVLLTQIPLLVGVIAGAFFTAVRLGEFRIYGFPPGRQVISAVAGGVLMGLGTRMAGGCNVTYVMGALPLFAFQGLLFVPAMALGSYLGVRLFRRFVLP